MIETENTEESIWNWSRSQTLVLIEELKKYPCLYNPISKNFTNKTKRNEKLNFILEKLKKVKSNVNLACIKRQISALQRLTSVEGTKMQKLENIYQPKLWCSEKLSFLYQPQPHRYDSLKEVLPQERNNSLNESVHRRPDKESYEKYILLDTIVHEWTQRCLKLNYLLTNYSINKTATFVAKFLEITDFKVNRIWTRNFKSQYKIKCSTETIESIRSATKSINAVKVLDIARDFRIQNKFPECIKKLYDLKFQYKDLNDETTMKPQNDSSNVIDLTETCEETINTNLPTENVNFEILNIQLNDRSDYQNIYIRTIQQEAMGSTNDLYLAQNNSTVHGSIIPCTKLSKTEDCNSKKTKRRYNKKKKKINNLKYNSKKNPKAIKKSNPKKLNISEGTTKCERDTQVAQSNDPVSEAVSQDDILIQNEIEEKYIINSESVSSNDSLPPVNSYEEALIHLKLLEDFMLLSYDARAINYISNLEDIFLNCRKEEEQ